MQLTNRRPLASCRYLGFVALTLAVLSALVLMLPHDGYIRYQSLKGTMFARSSWIYERIHFDPTPIDVAFIGSSRSGAGVNPVLIEESLAVRGRPLRVVNFSLPAQGMDVRLAEAAELLNSDKKVRLLVIDVPEALPRDGHQAFADLSTVGQALTAPWLVNRNLPENIARLPLRQIRLALASWFPAAFGYRATFDPEQYLGSTVAPGQFQDWQATQVTIPLDSPEHKATLEKEVVQRRRSIRPPVLPDSLGGIEFGVSRSYLEQITALASARGTKVVFLFLPFYDGYDGPVDQAWIERLAPMWNAQFMKDDPRNYRDAAHGSARLEPLLADFLAAHIIDYLPAETSE